MTRKLRLDELGRIDLERYQTMRKRPVVVVLDHIRSAHNVGAMFRTADAFAIDRLCLLGFTPSPPHPDITKTAIGATLSVRYTKYDRSMDCLQQLREEGYHLVGLEQTNHSTDMRAYQWPDRVAIVVGNEVDGISDTILPHIDDFIEIPQFGTKHSLNVSVAAAMAIWDQFLKS